MGKKDPVASPVAAASAAAPPTIKWRVDMKQPAKVIRALNEEMSEVQASEVPPGKFGRVMSKCAIGGPRWRLRRLRALCEVLSLPQPPAMCLPSPP